MLECPASTPSYIVGSVNSQADHEISLGAFRKWLEQYPWILIFDGLDEVPASSNRVEVISAITDFWDEVALSGSDTCAVVTTRPQGYSEDLSPRTYRHLWLMPLEPEQALHYARRLVPSRYRGTPSRQQLILQRLEQAAQEPAVARLMSSPLQVTIMAALVDKIGQPPQDRWQLFNDYYHVIYDREREKNVATAVVLNSHRADVDAIHQDVGLVLQAESELRGGAEALLSRERIQSIVTVRLADQGHEEIELAELREKIITAAMHRLVFLVGRKDEEVGFEIRSLQEFMAAEALMRGGEGVVQARLHHVARFSHWRNVFLFAAGKCFVSVPHQHLRDTVVAICAQLNLMDDDGFDNLGLTGSRLALDLLDDGVARDQPKYRKHLLDIALMALDLPSVSLHKKIAIYYEERFAQLYRDNLAKRVAITAERPSRAWRVVVELVQKKVAWALRLAEEYWPNDVGAQKAIFQMFHGDSLQNAWILARFEEVVRSVTPSAAHEFLMKTRIQDAPTSPYIAAAMLRHRGGELDFVFEDYKKTATFQLNARALRDKTDVIDELPDLSSAAPEWKAWDAARKFAADPSAQSLSQTLRAIAAVVDGQLWLGDSSWVLDACLEYAQDRQELLTLADKAAQGQLGDYEVWERAEKRLMLQGCRFEDLLWWQEDSGPIDSEIDKRGVPTLASWSMTSSKQAAIAAGNLLDIVGGMKASRGRGRLAQATLFALSCVRSESQLVKLTPKRMQALFGMMDSLAEREKGPLVRAFYVGALFSFFGLDWISPMWLRFVDNVGCYALRYFDRLSSQDAQRLVAMYQADPRLRGIRRLVAMFAHDRMVGMDPAIIEMAPVEDTIDRGAVAMLRFALGQLKHSEGDGVVADIMAILDICPQDAAQAFLKARLAHGDANGRNLVREIIQRLMLQRKRSADGLMLVTYSYVDGRRSRLGERRTWFEELQLTAPLFETLDLASGAILKGQ